MSGKPGRGIVYLEFNGERKTLVEWAAATGISITTIRWRYRLKLPTDQILGPPAARDREKSPLRDLILELATRPQGVRADCEIFTEKGFHALKVYKHASNLRREGKLFSARDGRGALYFDSQERAQAAHRPHNSRPKYVSSKPGRIDQVAHSYKGDDRGQFVVTISTRSREEWKTAEPYYPRDKNGKPLWKITIAPPPPAPRFSNTFSMVP